MARVVIDFPADKVFFRHETSVRISDENYFGHLGHDSLVTMLHEARAQLFTANGFREDDTDGCAFIVCDLSVVYRSEANYPHKLAIELAAGEFDTYGCEVYYRVTQIVGGTVVALAKTGHVFFKGKEAVLQKIPTAFLAMTRIKV
jgi:acyl-CoA thioesterase FadM